MKDFGAVFIGEKGKAEGASRHGYAGSPVIDGDHLIAEVGGKGAAVVCFDKKTGKVVWKSQDEMPGYAAPVVETLGGTKQVISFTAGGVMGLGAADGKLLWRVPVKTALGRNVTTPVVVGDTVLVASHQAGLLGVKVTKDTNGFKAERRVDRQRRVHQLRQPRGGGGPPLRRRPEPELHLRQRRHRQVGLVRARAFHQRGRQGAAPAWW